MIRTRTRLIDRAHTTRACRAGGILCCAALACIAPFGATCAPPPAEAFGRIPQTTEVDLSPSGNLVAWADNSGATQKVEIFDLQQRKTLRRLEIDPQLKLRMITWSDDETVLFDVSPGLP